MCQTNSSLYFILLHSFFVLCLNLFLSSISRMNCISSETRKTSLLLTKSNTCVMCASCVKCRKYIRLPVECKWPTNCGAKNLLDFFFLYSTTSSYGKHTKHTLKLCTAHGNSRMLSTTIWNVAWKWTTHLSYCSASCGQYFALLFVWSHIFLEHPLWKHLYERNSYIKCVYLFGNEEIDTACNM